jgi:PadR family transcriptional regulator, regulatory protein PadR
MGKTIPRITMPVLKVLIAVAELDGDEISGAQVSLSSKLRSGTLYPILMRLEHAGWLESRWEAGDPGQLGRPRRRLYRFTPLGAKEARSNFREIAPAKDLAWNR